VDTVLIDFDGVNYTATKAGDIYTRTFTGLAVGTYNYRWYANDTSNNWNNTGTQTYTINKTASTVNLLLDVTDANITVEVGSTVNITGQLITGENIVELYQDGVLINSGTTPLQNLTLFDTLGTYNITVTYPATENYSSSTETHFVRVIDLIPPAYSNINEPTDPATYSPTATYHFNITWTDNIAVDTVTIEFDGINYTTTKNGDVYNRTFAGLAATHNYTWFATDPIGNQNDTGVLTYTINKAASAVNLLLDVTDANITVEAGSTVNITGQLITGESIIELYQDVTLINTGSPPLTNLTLFVTIGTYNITVSSRHHNTTEL